MVTKAGLTVVSRYINKTNCVCLTWYPCYMYILVRDVVIGEHQVSNMTDISCQENMLCKDAMMTSLLHYTNIITLSVNTSEGPDH